MSRPEKAVMLYKKSQLSELHKGDFSRIYFGSETCDFLLPSETDIDALVKARDRYDIDFTIVTPYVTQQNFSLCDRLLRRLYKNFPHTEIVVNDWGVLNLINSHYPNFQIILGRIVNRQNRGLFFVDTRDSKMELISDMKGLKKADRAYFKASILQNNHAMKFLNGFNILRISLDNLKQGVLLERNSNIKIDLYYPFCYLTSSPHCLTRALLKKPHLFKRTIRCDKICFKKGGQKRIFLNETLYLFGNSQFYFNDKLDPSVLKKGDRLIKVIL